MNRGDVPDIRAEQCKLWTVRTEEPTKRVEHLHVNEADGQEISIILYWYAVLKPG